MTTYKEAFDANPVVTLADDDLWGLSRSPYVDATDDFGLSWAVLKENIQDLMNSTLVGGSNISVTYNDPAGTLTIAYTGAAPPADTDDLPEGATNLYFTNERAQDAVGAMVGASLVYVDGTPLLARAALTGDVTAAQDSNATTIANDAVTNAKMANMADGTIKGRALGAGSGDPTDLTPTEVRTLASVREQLTAPRTYYVRTDGSDSNTGLVNNAGGAFLTIQKAVDTVAGLDVGVYVVTIQVGAGTYTGAVELKPPVGAGVPLLLGDETTPANVVISVTSNHAINSPNGGSYNVRGFKTTTTTSGNCFRVLSGSRVVLKNIDFGAAASAHILSFLNGIVEVDGNYAITGGAQRHFFCVQAGIVRADSASYTCTLTGTPAFSVAFADAVGLSYIQASASVVTYSGSATGKRYDATFNAGINTAGGGANFFPGNSAGTTATGGQYG